MHHIFKIPRSKLRDYYSQSMFVLSYRFSVLTSLLFLILMVVHVNNLGNAFYVCCIIFAVSLFSAIYMKKFGTYIFVAKLTVVLSSILVQFSIYTLLNADRFVDMIWIVTMVLYSFYAISKIWGIVVLVVNFVGIMIHQLVLKDGHFKPFSDYSTETIIDYYLSIIFGGLMICYLLILFSKTQSIINVKYRLANNRLREKNKIVLQQNDEKTVMLKEIHHRVKNNLQVITSLLRLQSKDIDDPEVTKQFNDATNRVLAMSLIHEKIYQTDNLSDIDISSYFETLTKELIRSYTLEMPIETNITARISAITPDHMVPFALLLNELTSNSLKHGFKSKSKGKIDIQFTEENEKIVFRYQDNGTWNSPKREFSFGLELIETLTEQLDGEYSRNTDAGTKYEFLFPKTQNING